MKSAYLYLIDFVPPLPMTALMFVLWRWRTGSALFAAYTLALGVLSAISSLVSEPTFCIFGSSMVLFAFGTISCITVSCMRRICRWSSISRSRKEPLSAGNCLRIVLSTPHSMRPVLPSRLLRSQHGHDRNQPQGSQGRPAGRKFFTDFGVVSFAWGSCFAGSRPIAFVSSL